jgi:hypothetical protein
MSGYTYQQLAAAYRVDPIYWGVSSAPADTEAFIEALAGRAGATARYSITFTVTASGANKIYLCVPDRYGPVTFTEDGIVGGFITRITGISVTDTLAVTQGYTIYESVSTGLGLVTLTASWSL